MAAFKTINPEMLQALSFQCLYLENCFNIYIKFYLILYTYIFFIQIKKRYKCFPVKMHRDLNDCKNNASGEIQLVKCFFFKEKPS